MREGMHYYMRMGSAYAHLRKHDPERAHAELEVAERNWPDSAEVHYHLARMHCQRPDYDACLAELEKTYALARERKRPLFLRVHRSVDDWLVRAHSQSEFEALRRERGAELGALEARFKVSD
jgi:hypothetical protein